MKVTVTDDDSDDASAAFDLDVANAPPIINIGGGGIMVGPTVSGTNTWDVRVDFDGDNTPDLELVDLTNPVVEISHVYSNFGTFLVSVEVEDDGVQNWN